MGSYFKALFGLLALLLFVCFFFVAVTETTSTTNPLNDLWDGNFKDTKESGGKKVNNNVLPVSDLNYMSKRRVPNGPDPIHNRRAGNSGRPPGQA